MHVSSNSNNNPNNNSSSHVYLTCEQIEKLKQVLDRSIPICSSPPSSFPTLHLKPRHFLRRLLGKLQEHGIDVAYLRLNGGAASYVLVNDSNFVYRDIDIIIHIRTSLSAEQKTTLFASNNEPYTCDVWTIIKYAICACLIEHIESATSTEQQRTPLYLSTVLDTYAKKNIKISSEHDSWALLSLQNYAGQNLELKFVEHLKRQWQFSVDSFQIALEPLLNEKQGESHVAEHACKCQSISSITKTIKTKSLVIDAINGLTIIKKDAGEQEQSNDPSGTNERTPLPSTSPLQFGFFTPSSSPNTIEHADKFECQTLATITTIATSTAHSNHAAHETRSRSSKASVSTLSEDSTGAALQFHLSLNDDIDDGIVSDADDSANEDDDQVFRTPVDSSSTPSSPATIIGIDLSPSPSLIEVHSVYTDVHQAIDHLHKKLIATHAPETMRGGGLLKYCDLLAQKYQVHDAAEMSRMQRYMCSRFFIDYKSIAEQMHVITQYVSTHFLPSSITDNEQSGNAGAHTRNSSQETNNARLCLLFFEHLARVIQQGTVCLTHHDKESTLMMIEQLEQYYYYKYGYLFAEDTYPQQRYHAHHNHNHNHNHHHPHFSSSSSNSSRSSSPSSSSSNSYRSFHHNNRYRQHNSQHRHQQYPRQSTGTSSPYHGNARAYSNHFQSSQQTVSSHRYQRRHPL